MQEILNFTLMNIIYDIFNFIQQFSNRFIMKSNHLQYLYHAVMKFTVTLVSRTLANVFIHPLYTS